MQLNRNTKRAVADATDLENVIAGRELGNVKFAVGTGDGGKAGFENGEPDLGKRFTALGVGDDAGNVCGKGGESSGRYSHIKKQGGFGNATRKLTRWGRVSDGRA